MSVFFPTIKIAGKTMRIRTGTTEESYTENVVILPPNVYIIGVYGRVKTAFAGMTNPKVSVGVAGDTSRYMVAQPIDKVNELMSGKMVKNSTYGIRKDATFLPDKYKKDLIRTKNFCEGMERAKIYPSNIPIIATFTCSDSTLGGATAGEVEFIVIYVDPNT